MTDLLESALFAKNHSEIFAKAKICLYLCAPKRKQPKTKKTMLPKIRYRLVYNYANRLNQDGLGLVAVECRQGKKKIYMSTGVLIKPEQWCRCGGMVIDHPNADKLTAYLVKFRNSIEEIELNALIKCRHISLSQLRLSVKNGLHESASLKDFTMAVIENSERKETTKRGYVYLMNELEDEYGKLTLDDITYDWILKWRLKNQYFVDCTTGDRSSMLSVDAKLITFSTPRINLS